MPPSPVSRGLSGIWPICCNNRVVGKLPNDLKTTIWRAKGMPDESIRLVHASGECEIDLVSRELRVLGSPVPVGGRAFEIIEVLAQSAGELVTKDELMTRIWPGATVMENTLHVHAAAIRKALGPNRNLLKTESGRGYRLLGDWTVQRHEAAAARGRSATDAGRRRSPDDQLSRGRHAPCWPLRGGRSGCGTSFPPIAR